MNRLLVGMLLTLLFVVLLSGCTQRTVKGNGPLLTWQSSHKIALCEAAVSSEIGINPILEDRVGPADSLAAHSLPVAAAPVLNPKPVRRPARD